MALRQRQFFGLLLVLSTSVLSVVASPGEAQVSDWWLASALGACVLIVSPRRDAVKLTFAVLVLTAVGNLVGGRDVVSVLLLAPANAVESYVIARVLTRNWLRPPRLYSWAHLRRYVIAMVAGSSLPALASVLVSAVVLERSLVDIGLWVFVNHLACNLVLLLLVSGRPRGPRIGMNEVLVHLLAVAAAIAITYGSAEAGGDAFLLIPVAVWAASRFPTRLAVLELVGLGAVLTYFASQGVGPFQRVTSDSTPLVVLTGMQSFMAISVIIAVSFATAVGLERHRAMRVDQAKDALISTMSHELRTPLTSIVGTVELLDGEADMSEAERADLQARVSRNAARLVQLADDMLSLTQMDQREWRPHLQFVDLRDCVLAVRDGVAIPRERRDELRVVVEVPDGPVKALVDPRAIERVLFNLVGNAVKYTLGPGTVRVDLHVERTTARISVADEGMGIPAAEQSRLFDAFYRASSAKQRGVPGTGLGLSIVRSLVRAHGGVLGLESTEGVGSTFWFDLPLRH